MDQNTTLTIVAVQRNLVARSREANLHGFEVQLHEVTTSVDVVLLPEMFPSSYIANATNHAESTDGPSLQWMRRIAWERDALICGSIATVDNGLLYNRFYLVTPAGTAHHYDKRHLFPLSGEQKLYTPGDQRTIVEHKGWRILPQVCYDLRFPESARNYNDYDLLLYSAAWPAARSTAWNMLLKARAIENQCFLAACNRIGKDEQGVSYRGDSMVVNYAGDIVNNLAPNTSGVAIGICQKQKMVEFRAKYPFLPQQPL